MLTDVSKALLSRVESAEYTKDGIAKISLQDFSDVETVKKVVAELEKLPVNRDIKFDLNEGTMELALYNPSEDVNSFKK